MKYCNPKKDNDLFSMIEHQQAVVGTVKGITDRNLLFGGASPSYAKATAGRLPRVRVEGRGGDLRLRVEF